MQDKHCKLSLLSMLVASTLSFGSFAQTSYFDIKTNETVEITPSVTMSELKMLLGKEKQIIKLTGLPSYDEELMDLISRFVFISSENLKEYEEASFYRDGSNLIFMPGADAQAKVEILVTDRLEKANKPNLENRKQLLSANSNNVNSGSNEPKLLDYYTLTTSMGSLCDHLFGNEIFPSVAYETKATVSSITSSISGPKSPETSYVITDDDNSKYLLYPEDADRVGCDTALAEIKLYLTQPLGGRGPLKRNVEIKYKGMMRSVNGGGYVYDNGYNGDNASLTGFVDEIRFVTNFLYGDNWRYDSNLSAPTQNVFESNECSTTAGQSNSKTEGWSIGGSVTGTGGVEASASGEVKASAELGVSVSGGYSASRTVSNETSVSCESELFRIDNGSQQSYSRYYDESLDAYFAKTFFSSLQLARIGKESSSQGQSVQPYNTGDREVNSLISNIVSFQQSLDIKNRARPPVADHLLKGYRWGISTNIAHKPFYTAPGDILPEEIRNGFEHNATMTYTQEYDKNSNRYEVIAPRVETWYNPGYIARYVKDGGHTFGLHFRQDQNVTKKVVLNMPAIHIDWLDQRFMAAKTLGLQSAVGSNSFITHNNGEFAVKTIPYNATDFAQPFPIQDQEQVFYMTNTVLGDPNDKFQGFEINTYTLGDNNQIIKKCLGVNDSNEPEIMNCGISGDHSKTVWRYLTTSYINISEPNYDRSDFTICLRDELEEEIVNEEGKKETVVINQCLTNANGQLDIRDFADKEFGETLYQWNLVDLATEKINYRNYYNQDPI